MKLRTAAALCASVVTASTLGQSQPPTAGPPTGGPPTPGAPVRPAPPPVDPGRQVVRLLGDDGKSVDGVRLVKAAVHATVRGPLAEATLYLTFRNDLGRVHGGELTFPLPEGATVAGYGLDVNGTMVDGTAVEKDRARVVYDREVRRTVDPGLVEHVAGNAFRTRLYPINPNGGTRTVKVTYVAELVAGANGKGATLTLPLGFGEKVDEVSLDLAVEGTGPNPGVHAAGGYEKAFEAGPAGNYALRDTLKGASLPELTITLPEVAGTTTVVQRRMKSAASVDDLDAVRKGGPAADRFGKAEYHFVVSHAPPGVKFQRPSPEVMLTHKNVLIVWDASLSRSTSDTGRELKLLEAALAKLGHPTADLLVLRNDVEIHRGASFGGEADTAKLIEEIKGLAYDGATNVGTLAIRRNLLNYGFDIRFVHPPKDYDLALLFTDGLGTIGKDEPPAAEIPVYAVASDASANHALLRSLARRSGGGYANLKRDADAAALATIGEPTYGITKIEYDPAKVADVYPGVGTAVAPVGGRFTLAGRLLAPEAEVTVSLGIGDHVTHRQTFTLRADAASEGDLVGRFWATQRAAELQLDAQKNRDELLSLGRQFNLVTPFTSLLVLETAEQYVRHGVVPPKSRPEVYAQFMAQIETRRSTEGATREQKLTAVAAMWAERVKWWETEFKYPKDLKVPPDAAKWAEGRGPTTQPDAHFGRPDAAPAVAAADPRSAADAAPAPHPAGNQPTGRPPAERAPATPAAATAAPAPRPAEPRSPAPAGRPANDIPDFSGAPDFNLARQSQPQDAALRDGVDGTGGGALFANGGRGADRRKSNGEATDAAAAIAIKPWDPNTPYLQAMKAVPADQAYGVFLKQRPQYAASPAFYLDCADYLIRAGRRAEGLRVLSDVVELQLEDPRLTRIVAHRLQQVGELDAAIELFERVLRLRPEEPQSFRDLALALAARADAAAAVKASDWGGRQSGQVAADYGRALDLLNKVVVGNWDRFEQVELIALMEANRIAARVAATPNLGDVPNPIDGRLRKLLDCDVRIVLTWDADQTDVDLWVTEPSGEVCLYNHNRTVIGGAMSRDFTQGYGPEEYVLRRAMPGQYKIQANFYGSNQAHLTGPCTVQATVITNFGRPDEKREQMSLRLSTTKEVVTVGTVTLGK